MAGVACDGAKLVSTTSVGGGAGAGVGADGVGADGVGADGLWPGNREVGMLSVTCECVPGN